MASTRASTICAVSRLRREQTAVRVVAGVLTLVMNCADPMQDWNCATVSVETIMEETVDVKVTSGFKLNGEMRDADVGVGG